MSYLLVDSLVILAAGLSFSWENALYALVLLYISGVAAERTTEGENVVRTALIITAHPQQVADLILQQMERGVTMLPARGGYTGAERTVIYTVISRSEVAQVKALVREVDFTRLYDHRTRARSPGGGIQEPATLIQVRRI